MKRGASWIFYKKDFKSKWILIKFLVLTLQINVHVSYWQWKTTNHFSIRTQPSFVSCPYSKGCGEAFLWRLRCVSQKNGRLGLGSCCTHWTLDTLYTLDIYSLCGECVEYIYIYTAQNILSILWILSDKGSYAFYSDDFVCVCLNHVTNHGAHGLVSSPQVWGHIYFENLNLNYYIILLQYLWIICT